MKAHQIPFIETGFFSGLMCDYLNNKKELQPFHSGIPSFENLYQQSLKKKNAFSSEIRKTLCKTLNKQYSAIEFSSSDRKSVV